MEDIIVDPSFLCQMVLPVNVIQIMRPSIVVVVQDIVDQLRLIVIALDVSTLEKTENNCIHIDPIIINMHIQFDISLSKVYE